MKTNLCIIISFCLIVACQPNPVENDSTFKSANPEILKEVDRAFSKLSYEKGMNHAFETYIANDGVILRNNSMPIIGKGLVISRHFSKPDTTFRLTWDPVFAEIAQSGDLGYTYGTYLVSSKVGDSLGTGTYVSNWKQQEDRSLKFVFDAGNDGL